MDATLRLNYGAISAIHIAICSYKDMHIIFNNKKKSRFVIIFLPLKGQNILSQINNSLKNCI